MLTMEGMHVIWSHHTQHHNFSPHSSYTRISEHASDGDAVGAGANKARIREFKLYFTLK